MRSTLGATRTRLIRQLLVESFVLAAAASLVGCALAYSSLRVVQTLIPAGMIPEETLIRMNAPVLFLSLGITVIVTFLCGLAPAFYVGARRLAAAPRRKRQWLRRSFSSRQASRRSGNRRSSALDRSAHRRGTRDAQLPHPHARRSRLQPQEYPLLSTLSSDNVRPFQGKTEHADTSASRPPSSAAGRDVRC